MITIKKDEYSQENKEQHFVDEWGSIDTISYNEKTGKPAQQLNENQESGVESNPN